MSLLDAAPLPARSCTGTRRQSGRSSGVEHNLAKVGVEGSNPFARSSDSQVAKIVGKPSLKRSDASLYPQSPLHSSPRKSQLTSRKISGNHGRGYYTSLLHNRSMGVVCQNGIFHVRRRVPAALKTALGKGEIWRSLQTDSARIAVRRFPGVAAMIEEEFERARLSLNLIVDETLIRPSRDGSPSIMLADIVRGVVEQIENRAGQKAEPVVRKTISEVYDAYLADPRQSWCPRTAQSYETTKRWVIDVFGAETPIDAITRESCREFVQLLLHMPRFAYKRYPGVPIPKVVEMTLGRDDIPRISVANVNAYLVRFCCVMNWAEQEGFIDRSC